MVAGLEGLGFKLVNEEDYKFKKTPVEKWVGVHFEMGLG